jgi:hypothetical protein
MPILSTTPELLAIDLRTYGEDGVATRIPSLDERTLQRIFERAGEYSVSPELAKPSGAGVLFAEALSRAAVEVVEGRARPLRWKRRKLKGIYPGV